RAVEAGHHVIGLEVDAERVKRLLDGESYVEDVAAERLRAVLDTGRFHPTIDPQDVAGFDVSVITVPTPLREGLPDLRPIEESARTIGAYLTRGATVILESTTYPG